MYSFIKKHKWEFIFWGIQLLYWGAQTIKGYLGSYYVEGYTFGTWHRANTIVDFLTTVVLIGVVIFFLKNYLSWGQFKFQDVLKVLAVIFISGFIWTPLHETTGHWVKIIFFPGNSYPVELKGENNRILQTITMSVQMASCVISYICIKVFINFNAQRFKTSQLMSSLRQAQLSNLKNQISPHFLFNNLNNIRGLMLENPDKSRDMLTKLSEVLNYSLRKDQFDVVALKDELKMVEHYISLSKIQFETRLKYSEKVSDEVLLYKIPPMIIQLLVENAIKHGVSNLKKGGFINLFILTIKNKLHITVENSGKIVDNKGATTGVGLKNITKRLHFIYGEQATLSLIESDEMVVAEIKLPLEKLIR